MLDTLKWLGGKRGIRILLLSLFSLGIFQTSSFASSSLVIGWNASADTSVVGYKIYYGTISHDYTNVIVLGNVTSSQIAGLSSGTTYYFAATTYTASGQESPFSTEVSTTMPTSNLLTTPNSSSGQFNFAVNGMAGTQYVVAASTNLIDWTPLVTNTAPFTFVDPNSANFAKRFYYAYPLQ